jgi:hypothetical protein
MLPGDDCPVHIGGRSSLAAATGVILRWHNTLFPKDQRRTRHR